MWRHGHHSQTTSLSLSEKKLIFLINPFPTPCAAWLQAEKKLKHTDIFLQMFLEKNTVLYSPGAEIQLCAPC